MNNLIFLLTNDFFRQRAIFSIVETKYNIEVVDKIDLMVKLYEKNPMIVLYDIDSFSDQTLEMLKSILSVVYVPVIYIYCDPKALDNATLNEDTLLAFDNLNFELLNIIKQGISFKKRFDKITESYDAIDILNNSAKVSVENYLSIEDRNSGFTCDLLDRIYSKNMFLSNKPNIIWILSRKENVYDAFKFALDTGGYFKLEYATEVDYPIELSFDINSESGFYKNFNKNEISDIDFSEKLFPQKMKKLMNKIINFAGYSIDKLVFIGVNFNDTVTSYEVSILKAVTIYFDLLEAIKGKMLEVEQSFEYTTNALARAAEANDEGTGSHIKRVNIFSKLLAQKLGLDSKFVKNIFISAQMHDVGKIYVDKDILIKNGKLSDDEYDEMKKHTVYGERIIGESEYLKMSAEIARSHHEKYDGSGYPDGKIGEDIPLPARIVALADIYDALRSARAYKPAFSHEKAFKIITEGDGRVQPEHFDPKVLDAFKAIHNQISIIYESLCD